MNFSRRRSVIVISSLMSMVALGACTSGASVEPVALTVSQDDLGPLKINNAQEALDMAEDRWKEALKAEKEVYNLGDDADCFFERQSPEVTQVNMMAWCGQVAVLSGGSPYFSSVVLIPAASEDGEEGLELETDSSDTYEDVEINPSPAVDPSLLINAEGESVSTSAPVDPVPPAATDINAVYGISDLEMLSPVEGDTKIVLPDGEISLVAKGEVPDAIENSSEWKTDRRSPPDGHVFNAYQFAVRGTPDVSMTLTTGSYSREVTVDQISKGIAVPLQGELTPVMLTTLSGNVEQVLDLQSVERMTKDVAVDFYNDDKVTATPSNFSVEADTPSGKATYAGAIDGVTKTPWNEEDGWADNGRQSWLIIDMNIPEWETEDSSYAVLDGRGNFSLTDSADNVYDVHRQEGTPLSGGGQLIFLVPSAEDQFSLTVSPDGEYTDFMATSEAIEGTPLDISIARS